jgi:hypothetical protein
MGSDMQQDRQWHLDKRVPIALIITMILQTMAVVWWAAKADNRLDNLEKAGSLGSTQAERIVRLETKMDSVADAVNDLKVLLRSRSSP